MAATRSAASLAIVFFVTFVVLTVLGGRASRADEALTSDGGAGVRRSRLSLQLGLGAPLGVIGVGWAYAPSERFRVEGGIGMGATSTQLSLMPGLAFGSSRNRFVTGAGLALGVLDFRCPCLWLNVEAAGYEHVFDGGFTLFFGGGITMAFQDVSVGRGEGGARAFVPLPALRFGFGWWR